MSQSLSRLIVHIVFSTKARTPILHESIRVELYKYLAVAFCLSDEGQNRPGLIPSAENGGTDPHDCRPLLDRHFEIAAHPHRELG